MKTDKQIQRDVRDELKWDPAVNAAQIGGTTKDGAATLSAMVDTYGSKSAAERAVRVADAPQQRVVASDIKSDIEATLKRVAVADAGARSVDVNGGHVTVKDSIHSWAERDTINHTVWSAPVVTRAVDRTYVAY